MKVPLHGGFPKPDNPREQVAVLTVASLLTHEVKRCILDCGGLKTMQGVCLGYAVIEKAECG